MDTLDLFYGPNAGYVLELYDRYRENPEAVDPTMRALFERWSPADAAPMNGAATNGVAAPANGTATNGVAAHSTATNGVAAHSVAASAPASVASDGASDTPLDVAHIVGTARLIRYIREVGHKAAQIDPLGSPPPGDKGLDPSVHGVTDEDIAKLPASIVRGPLIEGSQNAFEAVNKLRAVYSGTIGLETDHIHEYEERSWLRNALESGRFFGGFDARSKRELLERLTEVETFERYLHTTFTGQRRFSLEGNDMLVPMLDSIIRNGATDGTQEIVIAMSHRGRLNVLAHILGKPYAEIVQEFLHTPNHPEGTALTEKGTVGWAGDVKYHLGYRRAFKDSGIESMPITLTPNPSHLEFADAVVQGRARAAQEHRNQPGEPLQNDKASLAILIHGDAAFPGQGVVAETLNMSRLRGYRTGGTIHIIVNNQIGFTTEPLDSRSTLYASDLAKGFEIPVVHVNADDAEACVAVARMAYAYREAFGKDFLIDLVGYRRWGHNEGLEPTFTQPVMYAKITQHPTVRQLWAERIMAEGVVTPEEAAQMTTNMTTKMQEARAEAEKLPHKEPDLYQAQPGIARRTKTAVPEEKLRALNAALLNRPEGFQLSSRLDRQIERRRTAIDQEHGIEWAHAEALAFASVLAEGTPIRLSGQDSEDGTFSQRHLVLHDDATGKTFTPLQAIPQATAAFAVYNSPLSEAGVLGFEYGYSAHAPDVLVLWEAQFGDFANGAQVIIDQFIISGRAKWGQFPALVLLLPHGYEGQASEHSSARLERFLQLAANDNIRVANCTTSAQYFHLLRRQAALLTSDPRPLIIMTPKSLLRHPLASSSLKELSEGHFQRVIDDPTGPQRANEVLRLVLCSGKIYIDLIGTPDAQKITDVAVARVEELYSFPGDELRAVISGYPELSEVVWMQEEPRNMGAWSYVEPRLRELLPPHVTLEYVGRAESATPAEGSIDEHVIEQARIIKQALATTSREPVPVIVSEQTDG